MTPLNRLSRRVADERIQREPRAHVAARTRRNEESSGQFHKIYLSQGVYVTLFPREHCS